MEWASVFDEAYPRPGATDAVIAQFIDEISQPMSDAEVRQVNDSQRNPFPKSDPLHAAWRPFDVAAWIIPSLPLPPVYLSFLRWSNGGEFRTGERWFQFFPALGLSHDVRAMLLAYHLPQYMPGALPFALNGGGTFYLFDMRQPARDSEYPIVCSHAGNLGWEPDECVQIAESFEGACRGAINVEEFL